MNLVAVVGCALLVAAAPTGCGGEAPPSHGLSGDRVAALAERELEAENPGMAPGSLECPALEPERGARVRCLRTSELSGGRLVKVAGTVEVTSVSDGGRLHVAMADRVQEFGVAGDDLADDVASWYERRFGARPDDVTCPYLRGTVGQHVSCRVAADGADRVVAVVVRAVDAAEYRTSYVVRARVD